MRPPTRLLLAGDTHSNAGRARNLAEIARHARCDAVLQLGDFSWDPACPESAAFIDTVNHAARTTGIPWMFYGGNHENWAVLDNLTDHADRDTHGFIPVTDTITYIPKGHRWQWHGTRFAALSGARTFNAAERQPFKEWWPTEEPRQVHADHIIAGGPLDVLFTHDAPQMVNMGGRAKYGTGDTNPASMPARHLIDHVVCTTRPSVVIHGHWHTRHRTRLPTGTVIEGLAHGERLIGEQAVVFSIPDMTITGFLAAVPQPMPLRPPA